MTEFSIPAKPAGSGLHPPHGQQQGFALVEVLVTIIIMALGLLGMANLQANGVRQNGSSLLRTLAAQQAYDMADRIRANPAGVTLGSYNNLSGTGTNPDCQANTCTPAQLANYDKYIWNTDNASLLPSGAGTVTGSNNLFTIVVRWDGDRTGATGTNCTTASTDLKCFTLTTRIQ